MPNSTITEATHPSTNHTHRGLPLGMLQNWYSTPNGLSCQTTVPRADHKEWVCDSCVFLSKTWQDGYLTICIHPFPVWCTFLICCPSIFIPVPSELCQKMSYDRLCAISQPCFTGVSKPTGADTLDGFVQLPWEYIFAAMVAYVIHAEWCKHQQWDKTVACIT